MRILLVVVMVFLSVSLAQAQTDTPTPTPTETPTPSDTPTATNTPTPEPYIYSTMQPEVTGTPGQMTRFDYTATAGDVQIVNLLNILVYSIWGMFLLGVTVSIVIVKRNK